MPARPALVIARDLEGEDLGWLMGGSMCMYMSKHIYTAQELLDVAGVVLEYKWLADTQCRPAMAPACIELGTRPALIFTSRRLHPRKQAVAYVYTHSQLVLRILDLFVSNLKKPTTNGIKFMCFYIILNFPPAVSNCY
jgi:hypothetical protein